MTAEQILAMLLLQFPGLRPHDDQEINGGDLIQELNILLGSWEHIDHYADLVERRTKESK